MAGGAALAAAPLATVSACGFGQPREMWLAFSSYTDRPMVITRMSVNGWALPQMPKVAWGRAEAVRPRSAAGRYLLSYPKGKAGKMALDLAWVELSSGQAYHAELQVPVARLERDSLGAVEFMPVFAPGGLLLITSDPVPASAEDNTIRDVVRMCGTRVPAEDTDFSADPGALPALREALAAMTTDAGPSDCP